MIPINTKQPIDEYSGDFQGPTKAMSVANADKVPTASKKCLKNCFHLILLNKFVNKNIIDE